MPGLGNPSRRDRGGRGGRNPQRSRARLHPRRGHRVGSAARGRRSGQGARAWLAAAGRARICGEGRRLPRDPLQQVIHAAPRTRATRPRKEGAMRFGRVAVWLTMLSGAIALASPAHAALADWKGHLEVGYAKLIQGAAPSGGISVATGVDYPLNSRLRLGPDFSYHLLGTRSVLNGSINGSLDYSMWEVGLRAQWNPRSLGPLRRV